MISRVKRYCVYCNKIVISNRKKDYLSIGGIVNIKLSYYCDNCGKLIYFKYIEGGM